MLSEATLFLVNPVAYVSNRAVYLIKPLRVGNNINFYIASIVNIVLMIYFCFQSAFLGVVKPLE